MLTFVGKQVRYLAYMPEKSIASPAHCVFKALNEVSTPSSKLLALRITGFKQQEYVN